MISKKVSKSRTLPTHDWFATHTNFGISEKIHLVFLSFITIIQLMINHQKLSSYKAIKTMDL